MEWLFRKMIENPGETYSPEHIKQILDNHQEILHRHQEIIGHILLAGIFIVFVWAAYIVYYEIRFKKFKKKLKNRNLKNESE